MSTPLDSQKLKLTVREKYAQIGAHATDAASCCGPIGCSDTTDYSVFNDDYSGTEGYNPEADLGLGCGLPTEFAKISEGDTVLDLGSGAGNDCFVARQLTGSSGKVIGLDMTEEMISRANKNKESLGFENVAFILGDIEEMPLENNQVDVVISNCVLNLVPDKPKAFSEIYRVLKSGGHFSISDVVVSGEIPEELKRDAEMYAGCVSGAIDKEAYLKIIEEAGFKDVVIQKEKRITLPNDLLEKYMSTENIQIFKTSDIGIFSITVFGRK